MSEGPMTVPGCGSDLVRDNSPAMPRPPSASAELTKSAYDDPVEDIAYWLAQELEEASLNKNDLVTVNREKLSGIARRAIEYARLSAAPVAPSGAQEPVGYADPVAFLNFKIEREQSRGGPYSKEWMWAKPDVGLVPLYTATLAAIGGPVQDELPLGLHRLETVQYWAAEFAKDPQKMAGGMIVQLLKEYADLRAALAAKTAPGQQDGAAWWKEMLEAVMREFPRNMGRSDNGNAPGHCHSIPGVWDSDNGAKAGTKCAWCLVWNRAKSEIEAATVAQEGASPTKPEAQ